MKSSKIMKKMNNGIMSIVILSVCLCITTFALVYEILSVKNNLFHTGVVELNLNDGKPIIEEYEFLFEPGMTVEKDFFIENESTWSVYYRIYMDEISGGLADVLEVTVRDGEKELYSGTAKDLTKEKVLAADDQLEMKERKTLTISFYFPKEKGNGTQQQDLSFKLCAEATQTKNNPYKQF